MSISPPDWSSYWQKLDAEGNERSATEDMIDWLSGRSPAVWHAFVRTHLDLERGERVAEWILQQPACDRATAAVLLFMAEPAYSLKRQRLEAKARRAAPHGFITLVLDNFARGYYADSRIEDDMRHVEAAVAAYRDEVRHAASTGDAPSFTIPEALLGPFEGAVARFPADADPYDDPYMWALLTQLGVSRVNRATQQWYEDAHAAWQRWQQERHDDNWLVRRLWQPSAIIPFGPEFDSEDERRRYLQGDAALSRLVLTRAKRAASGKGGARGPSLRRDEMVDGWQPHWSAVLAYVLCGPALAAFGAHQIVQSLYS